MSFRLPYRVSLLVVVLLTACTSGGAARPTTEPPTLGPAPGSIYTLEDLAVEDFWFGSDSRAKGVASKRLPAGDRAHLVIGFPARIRIKSCLETATLSLFAISGADQVTADEGMHAYPSNAFGITSIDNGQDLRDNPMTSTLLDNRPRGDLSRHPEDESGWVGFDISELYALWADGGPFPSHAEFLDRDQRRTIVLQIRTGILDAGRRVILASSESAPSKVPRMETAYRADCLYRTAPEVLRGAPS